MLFALDPSITGLMSTEVPRKLLKNDGTVSMQVIRSVLLPDHSIRDANLSFDVPSSALVERIAFALRNDLIGASSPITSADYAAGVRAHCADRGLRRGIARTTTHYSPDFQARYFAAQSARMNRLIDHALDIERRMKEGSYPYLDNDILLIPRGGNPGPGLRGSACDSANSSQVSRTLSSITARGAGATAGTAGRRRGPRCSTCSGYRHRFDCTL
jgi:hypothetical protein